MSKKYPSKKTLIYEFNEMWYPAYKNVQKLLSNQIISKREAWPEYTAQLHRRDLITLQEYFDWPNPFTKSIH